MSVTIKNLTPHPVTIVRDGRDPVTYPPCAPNDLPRATESEERGEMALINAASDGQGGYETGVALDGTGLVDWSGYTGVSNLPDFLPGERMFGISQFYIVSIVTAIGALAAGRGIEDLLVPSGQVRDATGRIIGATGLAPATSLLSPMYRALVAPIRAEINRLLDQRNGLLNQRNELARIVRYDAGTGLLPGWAAELGR